MRDNHEDLELPSQTPSKRLLVDINTEDLQAQDSTNKRKKTGLESAIKEK